MATETTETWNRSIYFALRTFMHMIAAVQIIYGIYYDFQFVNPPPDHTLFYQLQGFGKFGKFRFLTVLNAIWQAIYFTLCILNDFIGTNEFHPKRPSAIRKFKDYIFAAFAFPLALNVAISFWSIYAIDRELILPKSFDSFFPVWLNHIMHTNVAFFILMELFVTFRQYPSRKLGITSLTIFMAAYLIWIHIIKHVSGKWVYPILEVLDMPQRIVFMVLIGIFCISFYFVGEYLNNKVWEREIKPIKSSGKKQK